MSEDPLLIPYEVSDRRTQGRGAPDLGPRRMTDRPSARRVSNRQMLSKKGFFLFAKNSFFFSPRSVLKSGWISDHCGEADIKRTLAGAVQTFSSKNAYKAGFHCMIFVCEEMCLPFISLFM